MLSRGAANKNLKNRVRDAFGTRLGFQNDFGSNFGTIFRNFRPFLGSYLRRDRFADEIAKNAKKARNAKNACQNKTSITNAPRVSGRRYSPSGGFNGIGAKFAILALI